MKASIIIAAYNYADYIEEAIKSALDQDFKKDFEIIIVYREASDNTLEIIQRFLKHPKIQLIEQNGIGLGNATNIGINNSSGEFIVRLDADDRFFPNLLKVESQFLEENEDLGFVYPDYYCNFKKEGLRARKTLPPFDAAEIVSRGDFLSGGTMFRRNIFKQYGFYDESLKILENYEFILRLINSGVKGYHINLPLFEYRIHDESMSKDEKLAIETGNRIANNYNFTYTIGDNHPRSRYANEK